MKSEPILSIIIPTKNNVDIAAQAISAIALQKLENVEIIVQDNSDTDKLRDKLKSLIDKNEIKYFYEGQEISIVSNFNEGISKSTGEYVCLIGDDDGVHPEILKIAKWAKKNQIEVVVPKLKAIYYWPDGKKCSGCLNITPFTGEITKHNSLKELEKLLQNGCLDYLKYYLPKAYHGVVSRKAMEGIRTKTGNYFGGLVPDIYAVTTLALMLEEVVYVDFPLTISGISPKSNSGKAAKNKTNGSLADAPQLKGHTNYNWSQNIPEIFSGETLWADTLMHALDDMGKSELKTHFDSTKLHERLWLRYNNLRTELKGHFGDEIEKEVSVNRILINPIKYYIKKIPLVITIIMKYRGIVVEKNVSDIESAVSIILDDKNPSTIFDENDINYDCEN